MERISQIRRKKAIKFYYTEFYNQIIPNQTAVNAFSLFYEFKIIRTWPKHVTLLRRYSSTTSLVYKGPIDSRLIK